MPGERGCVWLVGAGPGDPDLLTIKALKVLQGADMVLYDSLVTQAVLDLVPPGAMRICVGKRAGRPSCAQEEINLLMLRLARQGKRVVRLKAGDPSIFGRAGEELALLSGAGIDVEVVPGITTASALAADLGTSLTHRACARQLTLITAHGADGGLPGDLDWPGLADGASTVIVYMGARTGPALAERLIAHGRAPDTPVVIAGNVSRPDAWFETETLAGLAERCVVGARGAGPVVLGIGAVFAGCRRAHPQEAEQAMPA